MAYIDAEKTAEIRKELKQSFSKSWKFLVRKLHNSKVVVTITQAPVNFLEDLDDTCMQVNHHHLDTEWDGEALAALKDIKRIANKGNSTQSYPNSIYSNVGWYFDLKIGTSLKPFIYISE